MAKPIIAIVGRPNVGKSTLFNKLTGKRLAIVEDTPGVTRDRLYCECEWLNHTVMLVDTGGIETKTDDIILSHIRDQANLAIESAQVIVFVTDLKSGVVATDREVASILQKSGKPVVLCVNKCDGVGEVSPEFYEFYNLGLGDPIAVSSVHGHGTGDLLDAAFAHLPDEAEFEDDPEVISVAVIGRPNVGKSSLINKLADLKIKNVYDIDTKMLKNKGIKGILFDIDTEEKIVRSVAVDGVRLAVRKEKYISFQGEMTKFVIPRKTVMELLKNLPDDTEMVVNVSVSHKHIIFRMEEMVLTSRRLQGEFLNYNNAIPTEYTFALTVDKRQFASSIERAALLVSPTIRIPIRCTFDFNMIKLSTATNMGMFYDEFEVEPFQNTLEVGFNHKLMLDALNACDQSEIKIELGGSTAPIVLRPAEGDDFIFLVLPMRLSHED